MYELQAVNAQRGVLSEYRIHTVVGKNWCLIEPFSIGAFLTTCVSVFVRVFSSLAYEMHG